MFRTLRTGLVLPAVVAALLWAAGPALARGPVGHGGGFHGGGFHGGHVAAVHGGGFHGGGFHGGHVAAIHGGGFHGGFHGGHVGAWHGGRFGGWGRGWGRGYGLGYGGLGLYGGYPYSYGYGGAYPYYSGSYGAYPYSSGSYNYAPEYNYQDVEPYVTTPYPDSYYNSPDYIDTTPSVPPTVTVPSTPTDTTAHIDVKVPASAEVWVEGALTHQTGTLRHFVSPSLTPGQEFAYDIRARWTDENGQVVDQTRHVQVHAGGQVMEDFTAPAPAP
jgi:uncharacterized protein (TIGR03000 family)